MKKLTKKMISEAPKYIVVIDRADYTGFDKMPLNAKNLLDAMSEAETYHTEQAYMIQLLEKDGTEPLGDGFEGITYKGILASRTKGNFHKQDNAHCETENLRMVYTPYWSGSFGSNVQFA